MDAITAIAPTVSAIAPTASQSNADNLRAANLLRMLWYGRHDSEGLKHFLLTPRGSRDRTAQRGSVAHHVDARRDCSDGAQLRQVRFVVATDHHAVLGKDEEDTDEIRIHRRNAVSEHGAMCVENWFYQGRDHPQRRRDCREKRCCGRQTRGRL